MMYVAWGLCIRIHYTFSMGDWPVYYLHSYYEANMTLVCKFRH